MNETIKAKLIDRRASKGYSLGESYKVLEGLLMDHEGDNLVAALVYEEFATEKQAEKIVFS